MTDIFHSRIRRSLADANLQLALDANSERRVRVRSEALKSLENPEELQKRAHAVRADVIEHLDSYLIQFTRQARENGMEVHLAADAAQANQIIINIASQQNAKLIAKSKTMVSEEIGLNHVLEEQGFKVVETDLGEYIVQLRGETPSHIITPAVHLRRQDVGRLFEEKLGLPYTEDISIMTNLARQTLREVFLDADIGISGVNFGVAECGTLCVVTNEGNGRMVTTLPRTHIALMGMERILPTMDDLALMLSLLPRSATGQKLSAYTSLLNSPRRSGDPDGPEQRHLILVDNGRKRVRETDLLEILYCIRCGACLNACPVFREIGGHAYVDTDGKPSPYPGPIGSVLSPALFGQDAYGHLARASSLCGACREACPVDIDLPKLLLRVRAGIGVDESRREHKPNAPFGLKLGLILYTRAASSPRSFIFTQWLARLLGWVTALIKRDDLWIRLPAFFGWGTSKDFPIPASKTFRSRYARQLKPQGEQTGGAPEKRGDGAARPGATTSESTPRDELLKKFASELEALGVIFISCTQEEVPRTVLKVLARHDLHEVLAWEGAHLPERLLDELSEAGVQVRHPRVETLREYSQIGVGLTGATAGIAETGTLLVTGGPGMPLSASLLPQIHIVLISEQDIFEHLDQVLNLESLKRSPAATLISGPSRTTDIEMTLTIGVHGPGELNVICMRSG